MIKPSETPKDGVLIKLTPFNSMQGSGHTSLLVSPSLPQHLPNNMLMQGIYEQVEFQVPT